ncbi:MAG: hypothetical protein H0X73_14150 [Chthoniobacterales bacterium]|nr:hypothetical protein [Chthoniobacterales bacterium]
MYVLRDNGALPHAIGEYEKTKDLDPDPAVLAPLASAYAQVGREPPRRRVLDELTTRFQLGYIPDYPLTIVHLALGEEEEASRFLERATPRREPPVATSLLTKIDCSNLESRIYC